MSPTVSVIIPCYNEAERILPVITAIKRSKTKKEIIVVDDGSQNKTKKVLQKIKNIKLITHPRNLGKSQAIKTGLLASSSEIIILIDADLHGLKAAHLKLLIDPLVKDNFDMVIGDLQKVSPVFKFSGYSPAYSGQRACRRSLLTNNLDIFDQRGYVDGFLLEAKINHRFLKNKKITKVLLKGVGQPFKIYKFGPKMFIKDVKIMLTIARFLGLKEHFFQLNFFRRLQPYKIT